MDQSSILIVGGGSIGQRHLRNLLALGCECAVVEPDDTKAAMIGGEHGIPTFGSIGEALQKQRFIAAFVCSPTIYHLKNALMCAAAGLHLFVEKPVAVDLPGIDELLDIANQKKLITMVGSNWKFYPLFVTMKEWLDTGAIGKVLSARCQFGQYLPDWHPKEDYRRGYSANKKLGGGILADSHEFDYLTWFMGDVARLACFAKKASNLELDVEDVAAVILEFKSGALGEIHLDYLQRFYQRNFEFFGEQGTIIWNYADKQAMLMKAGQGAVACKLPAGYDINQMYLDEARHFLDCLGKGQPAIMPLERGVKVLELIDAAKQSAADGQAKTIK